MSDAMHTPHPVVLVALDGSRAAAVALPVARSIAAQLGGAIAILPTSSSPGASASTRTLSSPVRRC